MFRKIAGTVAVAAILLLYSCGTQKAVITTETQLKTAYTEQNHALVLELFNKLEQTKKAEPTAKEIVEMAGISAFKTGNWDKTHIYLTRIVDANSNPETIGMLGTSYLNSGEKELEFQHWNRYLTQLENTSYYNTATSRLFLLNMEKENFDAARDLWEKIPNKEDADLQFEYLTLLEKTGQKAKALNYSNDLLKQFPNHEATLFWKARYYYDKAEALYQSEMEKYNKKPDYTSYAYLRRELKKVSADFRSARELFETLHAQNPHYLTYIRYLKNCYLRLEMKSEAARMDQLLNEPLKK